MAIANEGVVLEPLAVTMLCASPISCSNWRYNQISEVARRYRQTCVMDLLEYQAKELFREVGIAVPASQRIDRPADLKSLTLPYPIALKSQVYIGGRGRLGGVRFVNNTIDAIAAAHTIFNLPIMGELPTVLLAEEMFDSVQELYLAITVKRSIRRPILLGSAKGGVDVQTSIEDMQQVIVDQDFSPFYARRLALKMGLEGELLNRVTDVIERMYKLFLDKDLDLIEINPLAVNADQTVMALDGKVTANDAALARHPSLAILDTRKSKPAVARLPEVLSTIDPDGQIGILCNGAGLTMATMDLVSQAGGKPANFLNIGGETHHDALPETMCQRIEQGLEMLTRNRHIKVILINIVSGTAPCDRVAESITKFLQRSIVPIKATSVLPEEARLGVVSALPKSLPKVVVRLVGLQLEQAKAVLEKTPTLLVEDLDQAIAQTVTLSKRRES